ncbi:GRAM domain-containing protein / ABA-responsive protein-related [Euphorbia peplus]|nr:GRAM domain-containing protein / ABA-responsive protein-related [Euphorbia peplus]
MKTLSQKSQVFGVPMNNSSNPIKRSMPRLLLENASHGYVPTPANKSLTVKQDKLDSVIQRMNKLGKKADKFAHGIREHVRLGSKITETLKGKLSLGARIIQVGGVKKVFRQLFSVREGERLLKASQCYLSTTAGPLAGLLFISTEKIAFCSERSIKMSSPDGKIVRIHYKVVIPIRKIQTANQSENVKKPSQKYIEIVTEDDFDFWFMGFFNYQKAFKYLQQAISQSF